MPAGTESGEVASTIDLLPTLAEITGAELPEHAIDGLNILATLEDPAAPSPHRDAGFFYYKNNRIESVRLGKWKLHLKQPKPKKKRQAQRKQPDASFVAVELYDLDADIGETKNLADAQLAIVEKLTALARTYDADLNANARPLWRAGN